MSYKSASGYGSIENTPLGKIGYFNKIVARAIEKDFLQLITNGEIDERVVACNSVVQLVNQPKVGDWRKYENNQDLIADQITASGTCISICNAAYKAIKIDNLDIRNACERWDAWEESFLESCYNSLTTMWRNWVLSSMTLETDRKNKGANAGRNGRINLGQYGSPLQVNPTSIVDALSRLKVVLRERNRWVDDKMFIILPTEAIITIANSNFSNASWTGDCKSCSMGIDGLLPQKLLGFNVIESSNAPMTVDSSGAVSYYVIAGHSDAFAFVGDLVEGRLTKPSKQFATVYQMLAVWGGTALWPDALAVGYFTFV